MAETANLSTLDKLKNSVTDFKKRYAVLSSNSYGASISRTGDNQLMQEYGNTLARATVVNNAIDRTLATYQSVKSFVGLGDASLGAIPLIPLALAGGLVLTIGAAIKTIDTFMRKAGIEKLQLENPGMSTTQAATIYERTHQSVFGQALNLAQMALFILGGFLVLRLIQNR